MVRTISVLIGDDGLLFLKYYPHIIQYHITATSTLYGKHFASVLLHY